MPKVYLTAEQRAGTPGPIVLSRDGNILEMPALSQDDRDLLWTILIDWTCRRHPELIGLEVQS